MVEQFGEDAYTNGFRVHTTLDPAMQQAASSALRTSLHEYDERHGYRGVKKHLDLKKQADPGAWDEALQQAGDLGDLRAALVLKSEDKSAEIYLGGGNRGVLPLEGVKWARKYLGEDSQGAAPRSVKELLKAGDLIRVRQSSEGMWRLSQKPEVEGALVALAPDTGAIRALMGGFDFDQSKFNRASQAKRQPGSGFKSVLYSAALEQGFTPASIVNDAPLVFYDPAMEGGAWKPQNYNSKYDGPMRLRMALAKSKNMVSVRLIRDIGVKKTVEMGLRFGFAEEDLPRSFSLALGSGSANPLKMAQVYAVFANGGFRVQPYLVDRVETQDGQVLFRATPPLVCRECEAREVSRESEAPRVLSPQIHYLMHSMLQEVVRSGTATSAMQLGRTDLAGKTGTTNEQRDAWFNGYVPGLVAVSWMGFDSSRPLGDGETGAHTALPMWIRFMREALNDIPERSFALPEGLTTARIDPASGLLAGPDSVNAITEFFQEGHAPSSYAVAGSDESGAYTDDAQNDASLPVVKQGETPANPPQAVKKAIEALF
jgi:penicillin-binding protein 1A